MKEITEPGSPRLDNCRRLGLQHRWIREGWRIRCRNCQATPADALLYHTSLWLILGLAAAVIAILVYFSQAFFGLLR